MYHLTCMLFVLLLAACGSEPKASNEPGLSDTPITESIITDSVIPPTTLPEHLKEKAAAGIDFFATGNEPFWNIEVDEEKFIRYNTPEGTLLTVPPVKAIINDDGTKIYKTGTTEGMLELQVINKICINDMSGDSSAYTVHLKIKLKSDKESRTLHGCGISLKQ